MIRKTTEQDSIYMVEIIQNIKIVAREIYLGFPLADFIVCFKLCNITGNGKRGILSATLAES